MYLPRKWSLTDYVSALMPLGGGFLNQHFMNFAFHESSPLWKQQNHHNLQSDSILHFTLVKTSSKTVLLSLLTPVFASNQRLHKTIIMKLKMISVSQASVGLYGHWRPRSKRVKTSRHLYFKWVIVIMTMMTMMMMMMMTMMMTVKRMARMM